MNKTDFFGDNYSRWRRKHERWQRLKGLKTFFKLRFRVLPRISVLICIDTEQEATSFSRSFQSLRRQAADCWNLFVLKREGLQACLPEGDSRVTVVTGFKELAGKEFQRKVCKSEYFVKLQSGDWLANDALYRALVFLQQHPDHDAVYADEDSWDEYTGVRYKPLFKPEWSPFLARSLNYVAGFLVCRSDFIETCELPFVENSELWDLVLTLRLIERRSKIGHLPRILLHRSSEVLQSRSLASLDAEDVFRKHFLDLGTPVQSVTRRKEGGFSFSFEISGKPLVSILIPNKDHRDDLSRCLQSIYEKTTYGNFEVIVIENNSTTQEIEDYYDDIVLEYPNLRIIRWPNEFNYAAINNFGCQHAQGDFLVFLNNDTEIISPSWLEDLLGFTQQTDVGAVGARLLYADRTVQHAGLVLGMRGLAAHMGKGSEYSDPGYLNMLVSQREVSMVTGACLMMNRDFFCALGGFDENLAVAFNDVDLCMKVRKNGKLVIYNARAELYHYESKSRPAETDPHRSAAFAKEVAYFLGKWSQELQQGDPYFSPHLSLADERIQLA